MKFQTLPNHLNYIHKKKQFPNPVYSVADDFEEIQSPPFDLLKSNDELKIAILTNSLISFRTKRYSNILDLLIKTRKPKSIFFFIFYKFILPHLFAFTLVYGIIKLENDLNIDCPQKNDHVEIYLIIRDVVLGDFIYLFVLYLVFFENSKNILLRFFLFSGCCIISFNLKYFKIFQINNEKIVIDLFFFPYLFLIISFLTITKFKGNLQKKDYQKLVLSLFLFILGGLDFIVFRHFLIEKIYLQLSQFENNKIYFQCFLFIFYQIYGNVCLWAIQKFKDLISQNLFLLLIKIYISSVICSCIVLPTTRGNGKR